MLTLQSTTNVEQARFWVQTHCHHGETKRTLLGALAAAEAIEKAGIALDPAVGQDLSETFAEDAVRDALMRHFPQPTL